MSGLRGRPATANVIIERPELSSAADGSHIGSAEDVVNVWTTGAP
jgi:hypothetical protein